MRSLIRTLRRFGPYLLIELLLPGGTLVAIMLWLSQNLARRQNPRARPRLITRSVATRIVCLPAREAPVMKVAASALLPIEKEPHDLWRNRSRAFVELRGSEIRNGMRHGQKSEVRQSPGPRHGLSGYFEHISDDRCGRNAMLFKNDAVEHTARAA